MHYVEIKSELRRGIGIVKTRGTSHENSLHEFSISKEGMKVCEPFEKYRGVLSGIPMPSE
jgi:circadian clock protein KaiC